jgi:hypothetical protein
MIQLDEFFSRKCETKKLGYNINQPEYIPEEYLSKKFFVVFRTCLSFGDWVIVSAMPRLIKEKYPDATVVVPSPDMLKIMYPTGMWSNKHDDFHINVSEVFINNPYVDGMIDSGGIPIYHDHFRIYDPINPNTPLTEQMLAYWRFDPMTITDSAPELYWSDEEKKIGDEKIKEVFGNDPFGFLYIDDSFFESIPDTLPDIGDPLVSRRYKINQKINEFDNLPWLYYAGKDISETHYKTNTKSIDVRTFGVTLRVQSYIKTKSKVIIGHQGGYGTDCMSRYVPCHVVPSTSKTINEHFIRTTKYIL